MKKEDFKKNFDHYQKQVCQAVEEFPWENKDAYAKWLADTYHYVTNSTRILALGAGVMPQHHTLFSNRFIKHAAEETGHEQLLTRDIKSLGFNFNTVSVSTEMKVFYRSLYYWISPAGNPVGLLGWILALEGLATNVGGFANQLAAKNHTNKATNFLRLHSDEDPEHLEKALQITNMLSEDELAIVNESMEFYSLQYINILKAIEKSSLKSTEILHRQAG